MPHGADHLVVVSQVVHLVIFRQGFLQFPGQGIIVRVADAQDIDAVLVKSRAEAGISHREIRGNKNKIHKKPPYVNKFRATLRTRRNDDTVRRSRIHCNLHSNVL